MSLSNQIRVPLAARILIESHVIARIAAWPIEALDPFAAPDLAAQAREIEQAESALRRRVSQLIDDIFTAVPQIADRRTRAWLLTVNRAAYSGIDPWPEPSSREAEIVAAAVPALAARLACEQSARRDLGLQKTRFAAAYEAVIATQSQALSEIASDPRFLRALIVANPNLATIWRRRPRQAQRRTTRVRRLEGAILHYVLRAVGRATPSGAWAGVTLVKPGAVDSVLQTLPAPIRTVAAPDLRPFREIVKHLATTRRYLDNYPLCLDPAAYQDNSCWWGLDQTGRWVSLPTNTFVTAITDVYADGKARPIDPLVEFLAEHSSQPERIRLLLKQAATILIQAGVLRSALEFPAVMSSPWHALDAVTPKLREPECTMWREVVEQCRMACNTLASQFDTLAPDAIDAIVVEVSSAIRSLLRRVGLNPEIDGQVIRLDRSAPFEIRGSSEILERMRDAVGAVLACHAAAGGAEAFRRTLLMDLQGSQQSLAEAVRTQKDLAGRAAAAGWTAWERWGSQVIGAVSGASLRLDINRCIDANPGPGGTIAFALADEISPPYLCWARPQPHLAVSRLYGLVTPPSRYVAVQDEVNRHLIRPLEVVGLDTQSPNTAVRQETGRPQVGRHHDCIAPFAQLELEVDANCRPWLRTSQEHGHLVPVYSSTAGIGLSDLAGRFLLRLAMAHGWEFMSYGFPIPTALRASAVSIPRVVVWDKVVIGPRRWILAAALIEEICHLNGADQYCAWRREVELRGIGEWVWLSMSESPDAWPVFVRTDSPLIIQIVLERCRRDHCDFVVIEAPGDPARWLIRDQASNHYVAEFAVTWVDPHHWQKVLSL